MKMTDREKVMKGLECCIKNDHKTCGYKSEDKGITATPCTTFLMCDALELLKAPQKPIKPIIQHGVNFRGDDETWWYICGLCHTAINYHDKFCRECGKAVDWEETECANPDYEGDDS